MGRSIELDSIHGESNVHPYICFILDANESIPSTWHNLEETCT